MTENNIIDRYIDLKNVISVADVSGLSSLDAIKNYDFNDPEQDLIFEQNEDEAFIEATVVSESEADAEDELNIAASSESSVEAIADSLGIDNLGAITTGKGKDIIFGVANSIAVSETKTVSNAKSFLDNVSTAEADSQSLAQSLALAVGIDNSGKIATGKDKDIIVGFATADALGEATAKAKVKLFSDNAAAANVNSEAAAEAITGASGIDNSGVITTGGGNDIVVGVANTSTSTQAYAHAKAILKANHVNHVDRLAIAEGDSIAVANNRFQALGISNTGKIFTGHGNDTIVGLANAENSSNIKAVSKTKSLAGASASATALSLVEGDAVGIVNSGKIGTGRGHDTVLGVALNNSLATPKVKADNLASNSNSESNAFSSSDTLTAIAIGINNSSGKIHTGRGKDRIVGKASTIGILGGKIDTGSGDDIIKGYGGSVGIENTKIYAGAGNDHFQAAKVDLDPFTGDFTFSKNQTSAIKNVEVYGDRGHDIFKVGGFAGDNLIDGGRDFDVLKLWGDVSEYKIATGSGHDNTLIIESADSTLTVSHVEEFYFGDSDRAYHSSDFA